MNDEAQPTKSNTEDFFSHWNDFQTSVLPKIILVPNSIIVENALMLPDDNDGPIYRDVPLSVRIRRYFANIPLFCKTVLFVCIVVYIIQWITGLEFQGGPEYFGMSYYKIVSEYQVWRIFTHSYFHLGILHILFNMLALSSLGIYLERIMGTLNLFLTTICLQILNSGFYLLIIFFLTITGLSSISFIWGTPPEALKYTVGCGLSGELFSYMIFTAHFNPSARSCFGRFSIPAKIYPWLMLLIMSFLFPSASFMGHLCGILGGYCFVWFFLNRRFWNFIVAKVDQFIPERLRELGFIDNEAAVERRDGSNDDSVVGRSVSWIRERFSGGNRGGNEGGNNVTDTNPDPNSEERPVMRFPGSGNVLGSVPAGGSVVLPPPPIIRTLPPRSGRPRPPTPDNQQQDQPNRQIKRNGEVYNEVSQIDDDENLKQEEQQQ